MAGGTALRAAPGLGPLLALVACMLVFGAAAAQAAPLTLWGAGSLSGALGTVAADFTAATGTPVTTMFGPSGTLRQEIEAGARPSVFASADLASPLALQQKGIAGPVASFATDPIVAVAAPGLNVTSGTLLSTLLNPAVSLGTSTPVADPLGDYTEQIFPKANAVVPGAQATLDAKAQRLIAGPNSPAVPAGDNSLVYFVEDTKQADIFLTYATSVPAALAIAPDLHVVDLPSNLAVTGDFGLTILNGADPNAAALESYILSPAGQAVLASAGFGPAAVPEPASAALFGVGLAGLAAAGRRRRRTPARLIGRCGRAVRPIPKPAWTEKGLP